MKRLGPLAIGAVCAMALTLTAAPAEADLLGSLAESFQGALDSGSMGLALGLVFLAGLATALTPCVYPMIAITVSVFGARQSKSRTEGALLSLVFVLGIAALFTPLGVVSAFSGGAFGDHLANPWVLAGLAVLFLAMALSMFGLFDMNLPASWQNKLGQMGGSGYKGAFLVGFASGLVAAPCTGPVLAVLLAWVGTSQNAAFGALALFVYSLGLGVLFFVVGTFAVSLPKSGRWLDWIKSGFGIVMLVLALYYLRGILPIELPAQRTTPWIVGTLAAVAVGLGVGAIHRTFYGDRKEKALKGAGIALATFGLLGSVAWLEALPPGAQIAWREDFQVATAAAVERGRPYLIDFGADWCVACRELEHEVLSDPRVVAEAGRFETIRVDLSAHSITPEKSALLDSYDQEGLPLVVLHHGNGDEAHRVTGLVEPEEFLAAMRRVE